MDYMQHSISKTIILRDHLEPVLLLTVVSSKTYNTSINQYEYHFIAPQCEVQTNIALYNKVSIQHIVIFIQNGL